MKRIALALLLAVCLSSISAIAEEQLAVHVKELRVPQLMGVVQNRRGEPVAGVRVEIIRRENGHTVGDAKTDDQGRFAFLNLKDARYNIKVHHNGIADFYHVKVTNQQAAPQLVLKYK